MSQIKNSDTLVSGTQYCFFYVKVIATVTRFQSHTAPLGGGQWNGRFESWMCNQSISKNCKIP